ncbi:hypothetical protein SAMN05192550_0554 [Flavobacterium glycines]|uniref:Paeninodin family lasso peptide n=1 Tax=Flavobacterium glycines TaxID=551990 RepID=A0A1G8MMJ7_9FLAO|nr:hypothetical protein SAMN05192550_0554 [Flavobacterium glycines]
MEKEKKQWIAPVATEMEVNTGGMPNTFEDVIFSS